MDSHPESLLPGATRALAEFAAGVQFDAIPAEVIARMKTSFLDSVGCCLFGATLPWTQRVQAMIEEEGARPVASIFGTGRRTSVAGAVLVNATAGHAFELDDIHKESILHAGSIATPVVVNLGEMTGRASGRTLLTAMTTGYEIGTRVGNAATMGLFFRGFHPQGASGVFVAAAAAGRMLNLDADHMQHALGIVGSQAGGLMAAQEGAMVKRFHSGRAAQSGVYAAFLAQRDFTGISDVLEAGYGGYLSSYSNKPNAARVTVTTRDGRTYAHEILNRRGSPENPLSHEDVVYKFRNVVESCLSRSDIDRVIALSDRLDTLEDTTELRALLAAPRS